MNCRAHGEAPYVTAVVHGGPGAPGSASSLARLLGVRRGTLEPLQSALTVEGQIEELAEQIREYTCEPLTILGHSWGAWLSCLLAAAHPAAVKKLILIGSGAFDAAYVPEMERRRLSRLTADERIEYQEIQKRLGKEEENKDRLLERLGLLAGKADDFCVEDSPENREELTTIDGEQYQRIWNEASEMRGKGQLKRITEQIKCPVRIIHGAEDPTLIDGVVEPIKDRIQDLSPDFSHS